MKIAVIGAGITGCLLANLLEPNNIAVSVFEKSRGCGGRASTKQTVFGQCDIGASIVPAQKPDFIDFMEGLCEQRLATNWPRKIFVAPGLTHHHCLEPFISNRKHYVFDRKMNAACRHWIRNAKLHTNSLISKIRYIQGKGWQLKINEVWQLEWFNKVVLTAPWPQSELLIEQSELQIKLPNLSQSWTSCWSVALTVEQTVATDVDLIYLKNQALQTVVRDSAKPLRPRPNALKQDGNREIWVAQLANELSDDLGQSAKEKAISIAVDGFCKLFDVPISSVSNKYAHYWRYARPSPMQQSLGIISQPECGFYVGGDWSFGASIEAAHDAALSLSQTIVMGE